MWGEGVSVCVYVCGGGSKCVCMCRGEGVNVCVCVCGGRG